MLFLSSDSRYGDPHLLRILQPRLHHLVLPLIMIILMIMIMLMIIIMTMETLVMIMNSMTGPLSDPSTFLASSWLSSTAESSR